MPQHKKAPDDRRYSPDHIWVKKDGEICEAGITDYAQDQLGQVVYVELPEPGSSYEQEQEFGTVESVKTVNQLLMPLTGKVEDVNTALESEPALVNNDCYGKGWLIRIKPAEWAECDKLLDAEAYRRLVGGSK